MAAPYWMNLRLIIDYSEIMKRLILSLLINYGYYFLLYSIGWDYLGFNWSYYGFVKQEDAYDFISFIISLVGLMPYSFVQTTRQFGGAGIINDIIFYIIIVPMIAITQFISTEAELNVKLYISVTLISFYFAQIIILSADRKNREEVNRVGDSKKRIRRGLAFSGIFLLAIYVYLKKDVPIMLNISDIYQQRELGGSKNIYEGYVETLLIGFGACGLMVLGLDREDKRSGLIYVAIGILGYTSVFIFTMQRSVLFYPIMMLGQLLFYRYSNFTGSSFLPITFSILLLIMGFFDDDLFIQEVIGSGMVFRLLAIPALAFVEYIDTFSNLGFTYWMHIKPFSMLGLGAVAERYPELWPGLGYIVSRFRNPLGELSNTNANFIIGDGFAAAGSLGILIIFIAYALILSFWQKNGRKNFGRSGIILISVQAGLLLTNGHLFAVLSSFGFAIWLMIARYRIRI